MSLAKAAGMLGCAVPDSGAEFEGIAIDSRQIIDGNLFAALAGENVDGHEFLQQAARRGAVAALVARQGDTVIPQLVVGDVQAALGTLAAHWRAIHDPMVIGITGSNGKTTTRKMLSAILGSVHPVLSTSGNYNNELGLPLTLFGMDKTHRFAVLEMGAAQAGDIAYLSSIARQQVGLVTNVGPAHLQGFGDEEGVARAKAEIYQALPENGIAVINEDDPWHPVFIEAAAGTQTLRFGHQLSCDVRMVTTGERCRVATPAGEFDLQISLPGKHNQQNALAATAVAVALEIPLDAIRQGLANTEPESGRLNLLHSEQGWTVIDDTYNANPASLYAALQVLSDHGGEPWLVLGDMKELGRNSRKLHAEMGEAARILGVTRLFALGDATHATVDAFGPGGRYFDSMASMVKTLCAELHQGVTCLVKGSRSMGMERVVQVISGSCQRREAG
ncbi:MAG: UDP-N-acetylmuramoyl-tripeptide--D-alanyl-D-alanine ligase [Xanthomonadales bacterium]|nr:UDP-N-acetylmuramoyl-tripeptide--D-alanyl-D-alanine ligase [Gammaproteobacteria bacterium]NNE06178.1 UDP-N-acetylmuramoyl-tripeptide--D-alanyl-D-alanine ligase [Xanthomonadales bacterium]NNL95697.1 UDP-N-acetylmuramoyl-tripeptide--D-alanyl-D-alanine ligase [Xanthomonadales bacterium]